MSITNGFLRDNFQKRKDEVSGKQRIEFIDLAKGFCIILVVIFHSDLSDDFPVLMALRMPLYFILSGLFFKDYGKFLIFLVKKINRLVIPFLFFFSLGLLLRTCTDPESSLYNLVVQPFFSPSVVNEPIWFLICLFWVNMLYYFVHMRVSSVLLRSTICIALGVSGLLLDYYSIYLPLFLASAFSATPFFFVGVMIRKLPVLYDTDHDKAILAFAVMVLIAVITYCLMGYTPQIAFQHNRYTGNYPEIIIVSVLMVTCFLILCKAVKWLPVISYFGRYSIIVLGVHNLFLGYAYLPLHWITGHTFSQMELLTLTLLLSWISIPFFKKHFKKFCAQEDLIAIHPPKKQIPE